MKILNAEQIRSVDAYTIKHEPIKSIDLMERAANLCFEKILELYPENRKFNVFCGVGNNGGDGLVIARLLFEKGLDVAVYVVKFSDKFSADFRVNETRLKKSGIAIKSIIDERSIPKLSKDDVIIDAIFGTGLARLIEGFIEKVVWAINKSGAPVVSIDIPSGLFDEDNDANNKDGIVLADHTLTFEVPKLSFLLPENGMRVGAFSILDIGLNKSFIEEQDTPYEFVTKDMVAGLMCNRYKHAHKGTYGHALLIEGSLGKMGAAVLSAEACLRSGVGLLTMLIPNCGYEILQTAVPEAMVMLSEQENELSGVVKDLEKYSAIGVGPGIGTSALVQGVLKQLIQTSPIPLVIDADALNILGENKTWLAFLPTGSILTPHPKEFERVFGAAKNEFERLKLQREQSVKHGVYIVLKGAYSCITCPSGEVYFNSTGNPGMATAGSGDVLTGIITGLMAQGFDSKQSAILGVYLHGLAGDIAAEINSQEAMLARDIIYNLGNAYKQLKND